MAQQPEFKLAIIKAYFENDCSPILTKRALRHTVWAKEAARYSDPYPQTLEQLKVNIKTEMKKISKDTIESVVKNFCARTRHVLSKRGAWFEQIINY